MSPLGAPNAPTGSEPRGRGAQSGSPPAARPRALASEGRSAKAALAALALAALAPCAFASCLGGDVGLVGGENAAALPGFDGSAGGAGGSRHADGAGGADAGPEILTPDGSSTPPHYSCDGAVEPPPSLCPAGTPDALAVIAHASGGPVAVDETNVYWAVNGYPDGFDGEEPHGRVFRVPLCGGPVTLFAELLHTVRSIAVGDTSVFITEQDLLGPYTGTFVHAVAKQAGESKLVTMVADGPIATDGERVYWTAHDGVCSAAPDGEPEICLASGPMFADCLVTDLERLYWTNWSFSRGVDLAGGPVVTLSTITGQNACAVHGGNLFVAGQDALTALPIAGGSPRRLYAPEGQNQWAYDGQSLAADASGVYLSVSYPDFPHGSIVHVGTDDAVLEAWPTGVVGAIALSHDSVYWSETVNDEGDGISALEEAVLRRRPKAVACDGSAPLRYPGADDAKPEPAADASVPPLKEAHWATSVGPVWSHEVSPAVAVRLGAGNIVVDLESGYGPVSVFLYATRIVELDADGQVLWTHDSPASDWVYQISDVSSTSAVDVSGAIVRAEHWLHTTIPKGPASSEIATLTKLVDGETEVWTELDFGNVAAVAVNGPGEIAIAGYGSAFATKLDGSGVPLWPAAPESAAEGRGVAIDDAGNVFVAGRFSGAESFGGIELVSAGGADAVVAKLSPDGTAVWAKRFGSSWDDEANAIALGLGGKLAITGSFVDTVDFGAGPHASAGGADIFVAVLDGDGNLVCSRRHGDIDALQEGSAVAFRPNGNILVTGSFAGTIDFGGGPLVSQGGYWLGDVFVVELDAGCGHVWSGRYGDENDQAGRSIAVDDAGNVILAGYFDGALGMGSLVTDTSAAFVAKLPP